MVSTKADIRPIANQQKFLTSNLDLSLFMQHCRIIERSSALKS
jgi:hypothetical protein